VQQRQAARAQRRRRAACRAAPRLLRAAPAGSCSRRGAIASPCERQGGPDRALGQPHVGGAAPSAQGQRLAPARSGVWVACVSTRGRVLPLAVPALWRAAVWTVARPRGPTVAAAAGRRPRPRACPAHRPPGHRPACGRLTRTHRSRRSGRALILPRPRPPTPLVPPHHPLPPPRPHPIAGDAASHPGRPPGSPPFPNTRGSGPRSAYYRSTGQPQAAGEPRLLARQRPKPALPRLVRLAAGGAPRGAACQARQPDGPAVGAGGARGAGRPAARGAGAHGMGVCRAREVAKAQGSRRRRLPAPARRPCRARCLPVRGGMPARRGGGGAWGGRARGACPGVPRAYRMTNAHG
jgi:hypothetical protein